MKPYLNAGSVWLEFEPGDQQPFPGEVVSVSCSFQRPPVRSIGEMDPVVHYNVFEPRHGRIENIHDVENAVGDTD